MANTAIAAEESTTNVWSGGTTPMKASYGKLMMWFFYFLMHLLFRHY